MASHAHYISCSSSLIDRRQDDSHRCSNKHKSGQGGSRGITGTITRSYASICEDWLRRSRIDKHARRKRRCASDRQCEDRALRLDGDRALRLEDALRLDDIPVFLRGKSHQ